MFIHLEKKTLLAAADRIANNRANFMCFAIEDLVMEDKSPKGLNGAWEFREFLEKNSIPSDGSLGIYRISERRKIRVLFLCLLAAAFDDI
jgi:hypothetical protein